MARVSAHQPVLPSLLDRLIDEDPSTPSDDHKTNSMLLKEMKEGVRRDLENLLNTRLAHQYQLDRHREVEHSVVNYGLRDFSHVQFDSEADRQQFRWSIVQLIERFEPRLQRVQVDMVPVGEDYERTLYIKIAGMLLVEPDPVHMILDSRVRTIDRSLRLRELNHG
ncbi:type VI secretion system baseplate subunit TssE [Oceanobacter mangrovi]|uniref:type VI secretion system baseplate subunit TssE n=1 Tax=Oceanobacter mangrovi TaxID=2862510 RepID=UPI001C8F093E|nr:type VI secretion system baseplate subunit TssE [Oceanobacter mangrovi]